MADLKIEGDLSQASDRQLEYIKTVLRQRGYINNKVTVEPVGVAGDNYMANVKRITVIADNKSVFKTVVKLAPQQEILRKMANTDALFRNEQIMYTKLLPKYTQIEAAAEVPPQDRLRYAECYGSSEEVPHEVIMLEDLKEANFTMLDRFKPLSNDCVKSVLKNFASLHSLSYALKYKEPEFFDEVKNRLFDIWQSLDTQPDITVYFQQIESNAAQILDSDVHKKAVLGAITKTLKDFAKTAKTAKESKHSIIQQGDAWTNNIMFKFDGETLLESIMIDYQLSKPTNPVSDLHYMIFNCTDYESRKAHYYDWIDYYHSELDKALANYGLKANYVFPKDQLDVDLKRYGKIGFGLSILLAGMLSMKSDEAAAIKTAMETAEMSQMVKDADMNTKDPETISIFKKRLEGLVDSYREFGLI